MPSYEIPPRDKPAGDNGYFEQLTKAVFQVGFSWQVVNNKWPEFQKAFDYFDVDTVAGYDERDVDRLLSNEGIVRNARKIEATIANARECRRIIDEHGSLHAYLRSMDDWTYPQRRKELAKRFRNAGPTSVFTFLHCVDEEVPAWEDRNK
ncbi:MAG: DNA-3-methyladenine glycosylase 1 [Anaerolineales bacterium]|nr:DNA-3-methyladenine glycosylase 1 [Anaerolineales bacterium]